MQLGWFPLLGRCFHVGIDQAFAGTEVALNDSTGNQILCDLLSRVLAAA